MCAILAWRLSDSLRYTFPSARKRSRDNDLIAFETT